MFSCCVPVSRGCRLGGARGHDASRPWRQCVRSCTGRLRSLARRDPKKSTNEIGRRLSESRFTCPTELCECPVAQEGHPGPRERVAARRSREAGPRVGLGRPPSPPWPLHRVLVHRSWDEDPEPPEPEPEESGAGAEAGAAPEPNPRASGSSESLQSGVESGATPAGAGEPAALLAEEVETIQEVNRSHVEEAPCLLPAVCTHLDPKSKPRTPPRRWYGLSPAASKGVRRPHGPPPPKKTHSLLCFDPTPPLGCELLEGWDLTGPLTPAPRPNTAPAQGERRRS
ncbi:basic salivary proline-rich protein 4-like [Prionailurus viverrinus]|uniref:basic salivary proline-rich protein 4-like n=1 Tax=Prionailurus viverrinus TaxID=61388 RepID=UPI001FF159AA|nr:basic salivary proline-rich protein 4-like [Prionailurus viverrinus]